MVIRKDKVDGIVNSLSPSLNPSRKGREEKFPIIGLYI
jgi:hypothetical protein